MNLDTDGFTCYWRIENFILRRPKKNLLLTSPEFYADLLGSEWSLEISEEEPGYIALFFQKKSNYSRFKIGYSTHILTRDGWKTSDVGIAVPDLGDSFGDSQLVSWQDISNDEWYWLPYGCLTVSVHIKTSRTRFLSSQCLLISRMISGSWSNLKHLPVQEFCCLAASDFIKFDAMYPITYQVDAKKESKTESIRKEELSTVCTQTEESILFRDRNDLLRFFKEKDFDFVTLRVNNKDFIVHKAVLCAKSPVFNAMFERKMLENERSLVEIKDIDSETLVLLIRYLHFVPFRNLKWEEAMNLYYTADKYQIEELKEICLGYLNKELSLQTVCDIFITADLHQDENLFQRALEFFSKSSKFILKSDEWKNLMRNRTDLATEILEKLADKM